MEHSTSTQTLSWYLKRLFVKQGDRLVVNVEKARIRTLDWKPPAKITLTACMLCATRPIDLIAMPVGDGHLLERLGLTQLGGMKNRKLAQQLREMP
jgi:hypothetical protein